MALRLASCSPRWARCATVLDRESVPPHEATDPPVPFDVSIATPGPHDLSRRATTPPSCGMLFTSRVQRRARPPHPAPRRVTSATPLQWGGIYRNIILYSSFVKLAKFRHLDKLHFGEHCENQIGTRSLQLAILRQKTRIALRSATAFGGRTCGDSIDGSLPSIVRNKRRVG